MTDDEFIRSSLEASAAVKQAMISACGAPLQTAADLISAAMLRGNSLLICGNGGSAADSQHIATEFVVRLSAENRQG
ncbi:MAG: SIS domain-containing protein [bacterium]|nr:SIS domain-containing protein [bacterium]